MNIVAELREMHADLDEAADNLAWTAIDGRRDKLLEAADRIERLEAAVRRSLDWLSSYPGGGAHNAWRQAHDALEPLELPTGDTK